MKYIGSARNVRELLDILDRLPVSATITMESLTDSWTWVEVWFDEKTNDVIFK